MATITNSITIDAPPEHVWSRLADFAAISSWAPNVDHSCLLSDQTEGVGMTRRVQTQGATVRERVIVWEPNATLGYEIIGLPQVIKRVTNTWTIEPQHAGTRVTLTGEIDAGARPPQKVIANVAGKQLAKASETMLDALATSLQSEATS